MLNQSSSQRSTVQIPSLPNKLSDNIAVSNRPSIYNSFPIEDPSFQSKPEATSMDEKRTCFIGGIHIHLNKKDFLAYLATNFPSVEVEQLYFKPSKKNPKVNKGFGFVTFRTQSQFEKMLGKQLIIRGKRSTFRRMQQEQPVALEKRVVLKNLHRDVKDSELIQILEREGLSIERCYIITDSITLKSKGLAFVDFQNCEDMESCLKSPKLIKIRGKAMIMERYKPRAKAVNKKGGGKRKKVVRPDGKAKKVYKKKNKHIKKIENKPEFSFASKRATKTKKNEFMKQIVSVNISESKENYRLNAVRGKTCYDRVNILLKGLSTKRVF